MRLEDPRCVACPACGALRSQPCVDARGDSIGRRHHARRIRRAVRFFVQGRTLVEHDDAGSVVVQWVAPSKARARRAFELLELLESLAALDASGSNRERLHRDELASFGCVDRYLASPGLRALLDEVHRAGFTARIGCRYDVLVRGRRSQ